MTFPQWFKVMANIDKVSMALSEWAFKVASSFLPAYRIPQGSTIGNMMQGLLGINPQSYNVWHELGFLAEPIIQSAVTPMVYKMLGSIPDEQIPDMVQKYVDAFIAQAQKKGSVNLFGIELKEDAFRGLGAIMAEKFKEGE